METHNSLRSKLVQGITKHEYFELLNCCGSIELQAKAQTQTFLTGQNSSSQIDLFQQVKSGSQKQPEASKNILNQQKKNPSF